MARIDPNNRWMLIQFPYNIAMGPLGTLVALYILELGGNAVHVAYAIALSILVSIPSLILWGKISDYVEKRKPLIFISYLGVGLMLLGMYMVRNIDDVILIYAVQSFITAASAAPISLLVMEKAEEKKWSHNFSLLQMLSGIGTIVGLVAAFVITAFIGGINGLLDLTMILALASLGAAFLTLKMLKEPESLVKRSSLVQNVDAFIVRLIMHPLIFLRVPRKSSFKKVFSAIYGADGKSRYLFILYMIAVFFYFGTNVFNTEYPVGLKEIGLSESIVFAVILIGNIIQVLAFLYYDKLVDRKETKSVISLSLAGRSIGYILIGVTFLLAGGSMIFGTNLILYPIAAGLAYAIYYTASSILLFEAIGGSKKGSTLGVYSSLISVGSFMGALASGYLSTSFGYGPTFMLAGVMLIFCIFLFRILLGEKREVIYTKS